MRATTAQLYPGRDTFEFDQGHVTKNQPITVLILLSESLAIQQFQLFIFYKPACLQVNFHGRVLSIRVFSVDGHYLINRVFLSRNYWLIVAPRKFDVFKTNICPRSEASRANMLVLRTSNFQGATIRPIVPRHKHSIVFIVHH